MSTSLVRTRGSYAGLVAPFGPGKSWPELAPLGPTGPGPFNHVYAAVREALLGLGLDAARAGTDAWNPLGSLVPVGGSVVLKPNFIRHFNPAEGRGGTLASVVTHGAVLRALADYALLAVGPGGSVSVAEAPQQDCDFEEIRRLTGLDAIERHYEETLRTSFAILDLRREVVRTRAGVIVSRHPLPGDPLGYREVDLGANSFFEGSGLDPLLFRGADYDPGPTTEHHCGGRNAYLLSETVLRADLVVNLPKLKTHKKTGVTLALKNLVGINGDKNWLPHHTVGGPREGGDEHPDGGRIDRLRSRALERARPWLARGRAIPLFQLARRIENAARRSDFVRAGNWHGNRTTWRMCCDLNRALYYSNRDGTRLDAPAPLRRVLTVIDGIVAGEGEGPLAPLDVGLGAIVASTDPVAADLVALRLMGFDERRIPKVREAMADTGPRITEVRTAEDVRVVRMQDGRAREGQLADVTCDRTFKPHPGWRGAIERS